jgi:ribonuclease HI
MATEQISAQLHFDGSSLGNPGPSGSGCVLEITNGPTVTISAPLLRSTNNYAEYYALFLGLQKAKELKVDHMNVIGDSLLVVKQVNKEWNVRAPNLQSIYNDVQDLVRGFREFKITHTLRDGNAMADQCANDASARAAKSDLKIITQSTHPKK